MSTFRRIRFSLAISPEQYLTVYQGSARNISVIAEDGRRIEFPAQNIQRFLTREGIYGHFEMQFTANYKFVEIQRIER